jgi:hypothetical protein
MTCLCVRHDDAHRLIERHQTEVIKKLRCVSLSFGIQDWRFVRFPGILPP